MKKIRSYIAIGAMFLLTAFLLAFLLSIVIPGRKNAAEKYAELGSTAGELTGRALGSYDGITEGISAGHSAGKEEGLSAKDTSADIKGFIAKADKLEVLVAGVKLVNDHGVGEDYKGLYLMKADAVFTVDLTKAEVEQDEKKNTVTVRIPEPEMNVYIDEAATTKLAEYQKGKYTGSAADGYKAYINSVNKSHEEISREIGNYDQLMEDAKNSALKQVGLLAEAACMNGKTASVEFLSEGE